MKQTKAHLENTEAKGDAKHQELTGLMTTLLNAFNAQNNQNQTSQPESTQPEIRKNLGQVSQETEEVKKVHRRDEDPISKGSSPTASPTKKKSKESSSVEENVNNESMEIDNDKDIENSTSNDSTDSTLIFNEECGDYRCE